DVLGRDNDAADVALGIAPGINGGCDPLLDAIRANPNVFSEVLLFTGESAAVGFLPLIGEIRNQVVKAKTRQVRVAKAVIGGPAAAGGKITDFPIEHGDAN